MISLVDFDKLQPVFLKIWHENPEARHELADIDVRQFERGKVEKDDKTFVQLTKDEIDKLKTLYESII